MRSNLFATAAVALYRCGYSVLPILSVNAPFDGRGKAPGVYGSVSQDGTKGPWYLLKEWEKYCIEPAPEAKAAAWGRMADVQGGGLGVACGFGGLVAIDCDRDELIKPIRAILPPILVEKFGRKGFTAFYRSEHSRDDEEWWKKKNYGFEIPDPDDPEKQKRVGLLDFLAAGSQTVLPPSRHKDTGEPYRWLTPATLLNTPLEALPVFTDEHRVEMERVLRDHGWDAPEPAKPRSRATVARPVRVAPASRRDDDVNDAALMNLSAWVPVLGLPRTRPQGVAYRAVAPWRSSSSGRPEARRGTHLSFHPTGIVDFGSGDKFTPVGVVAKARDVSYSEAYAWLRAQLGLTDTSAPAPASPVQATYLDRSVPLDIGVQKLREEIAGFETVMREWRDIRAAPSKTRIVLDPPVNVIRIGTSAGKTHETAAKIAAWLPQGYRIAVAVPDHKMARQVAETIGAHGVSVAIYRGCTQPDPLAPEHKMCRNLLAYKAACDLGVNVRSAVCERCEDGKIVRCDFIDDCGRERQRKLKPDVWVVTHATLLYARPEFITELDGLVIDEKFFDKTIGKSQSDSDDEEGTIGKSQTIDVAVLRNSKIEGCNDEEHDFLTTMRHRLFDAVKSNDDGFLTRRVLKDAGISADDASKASVLEQRRVTPKVLTPGMADYDLKSIVRRHKSRNKDARAAGGVWDEIDTLLGLEREASGRLKVAGSKITVTQHRPVHPSWHTATLILDATSASSDVLVRALFGDVPCPDSVSVTDISIKRPDYVHVRQVFGAPVTMGKLGLLDDEKPRNVRSIMRYIRWCAALTAPGEIGLISHKQFVKEIKADLPANVTKLLHFGVTSGRNDMERVAGMIVIGRPWVPPAVVEANAAVLTGVLVPSIERYELSPGGVRKADGSIVARDVERHPHPIAEEIRRQVTETGVEQAKGRLRDLRRKESCWMDILNDVVLPGAVNEAVDWKKDVRPGAECDMAAEGVILTNSRDIMTVFGASKDDAEAVGNCPAFSIESLYRKSRAIIRGDAVEMRTLFSPVKFSYRRQGKPGRASTGYLLPAILPEAALHGWLEERLNSPVSLEFERRTVWMGGVVEREPAGMPIGELVRVFGGWWVS